MAASASDNPGHGFCPRPGPRCIRSLRFIRSLSRGAEHLVTANLPVLWLCGPPGIGKCLLAERLSLWRTAYLRLGTSTSGYGAACSR